MADLSYGAGGGNLDDLTRRAQAAAEAVSELQQKEQQRATAEEKATSAEQQNREAKNVTADATTRLTQALQQNISRLESETSAVRANTAAWAANAEARTASGTAGAAGRRAPRASGAPAADLANLQAANQRLQAERLAAQQAELQRAAQAVGRPGQLALPAGQQPREPVGLLGPGRVFQMPAAGSHAFAESERSTSESTERASQSVSRQSSRLEELRAQERQATLAVNEAGAAYANYSTALTRHGALTSEFIQAFARGQVTLREFEGQMVSTIGKFGGWAVAGAAVYGLFDALKHVKNGATETQAAVLNLGRFLPGLGGPAGGGSSQIPVAEQQLRGISTQFNLPIKDVGDAMSIMARTFHNVTDAAEATRAVLAAYRLDQINRTQAEQYLTGISHSLGFTTLPQGQQGAALTQVVNGLNALQNTLGARVTQTLPAISRAAPAALAEGVTPPELEAMAALGVSSGQTGNQVGTALLRSMTRFAWQGGSTFRQYGITPQVGQYGDLFKQVIGTIDTRQQQGKPLSGVDLQRLAQALGGPQLGSRSILPLLLQEQINPGAYNRALGTAQHPPSYQQDLGQVLGSLGERAKSVGIALENFGSRVGPIILQPLVAAFSAFGTFIHLIEGALSPFAQMVGLFQQIPGPIRDIIGLFLALKVGMRLYQSSAGQTAQGFIGRLPGLSALGPGSDRQAVAGTLGRLQTYLQPQADREAESAVLRHQQAAEQFAAVKEEQRKFQQRAEAAGTHVTGAPGNDAYLAARSELEGQANSAQERVNAALRTRQEAETNASRMAGDTVVLKDTQLSTEEKITYLKNRQYVLESELVDIRAATVAEARAAAKAGTVPFVGGGLPAAAPAARGGGSAEAAARAASFAAGSATASRGGTFSEGPPGFVPQAGRFQVAEGISQRLKNELGTSAPSELLTGGLQDWRNKGSALIDGAKSRAGGALESVKANPASLAGTGPLLAATIGTSLLGGALQGAGAKGPGDFVSGVLGQGATGALLASFLRPGSLKAAGIGAIFGNIAGSFEQGGTTQGIASGIGAGVGAGIGSLVGPEGTVIGGLLGSTVGSIAGQVFGGGKSQQQQASQAQQDAKKQLQQLQGSQGAIDAFGNKFQQDLSTAFAGNGDAATKAQAKIQTQIAQLTAEIQLFGRGSPQGKAALQQLNAVVGAAVDQATTDPAAAKQILDTVANAQSAIIQKKFQYLLSLAGPGQGASALTAVQPDLFQNVNVLQQQADDANAAYQASLLNQQQVAVGGPSKGVTDARTRLKNARDIVGQFRKEGKTDSGGNFLTEALGLASTPTGYDDALHELDKAQANLNAELAKTGAQTKQDASKLTDKQKADAAAKQAVLEQAKQDAAIAQQQLAKAAYQQDIADITSGAVGGGLGALGQARAGADPMAQLRVQLRTQQAELARTQSDTNLDPVAQRQQIAQISAQIIDTQAKMVQQQLPIIQSRGAVAESQVAPGDQVGQLRVAYDVQVQQLNLMQRNAHNFDPSAIRTQVAATNNAWKQWYQAVQSQAQQLADIAAQTQAARDYGNSVQQAFDLLQGAITASTHAVGPVAQAQAQQQIAQAQAAYQQAQFARIASETALGQAQHPGDLVTQAQIAQDGALRELAMAHGTDQVMQAERDLATANQQLADARATRFQELGALAASQTASPIKQLQAEIAAQAKALSVTVGVDSRIKAQTELNNLKIRYDQELASTREGTIQFQFDMMQITAQQAIHQLQDLLKLKNLTNSQRQQILEQIRRFALGQVQPLGATGFDLAPGNIKLPSFYDVQHAIRHGRPGPLSGETQINAPNVTNIYVAVARGSDVPKVADAIDRATGSRVRARLRAAGVR